MHPDIVFWLCLVTAGNVRAVGLKCLSLVFWVVSCRAAVHEDSESLLDAAYSFIILQRAYGNHSLCSWLLKARSVALLNLTDPCHRDRILI